MSGDTLLAGQIDAAVMAGELPPPEREYKFHPTRRWRFDWAWPASDGTDGGVALEYEGGSWQQGRHVRPQGYEGDCEKYSEAAILGWLVIRATLDMVRDGRAMDLVIRALQTHCTHDVDALEEGCQSNTVRGRATTRSTKSRA